MFALSYTFSAFRLRTLTSKQLSAKHDENTVSLFKVRGSSTHVASRTKFFVATLNGWESLIVDTKISILVALGVLDSLPDKYFVEINLKMTQW